MRALLINPWIYDFAAYDLWAKPMGLLNIAGCLKKLGVDLSLIDCQDRFDLRLKNFLDGKPAKNSQWGRGRYFNEIIKKPEIFKNIPRHYKRYGFPLSFFQKILDSEPKPDVILVTSAMTYWYLGVFDIISLVKTKFPDVPIILGGIYAQLCSDHARKNSKADFVYSGHDINEILLLINKVAKWNLNITPMNIQEILPYYDLYDHLEYITLRTSVGCPNKCSYCGWYLLEKDFYQIKPSLITNYVEYYYKRGIKDFAFYDDALLYNADKHLKIILNKVVERGIKINFHTPGGLHVRLIDQELALLFKKAGFVNPRLGFETAVLKRHKLTGSKTCNEDFLKVISYLKKAGYDLKDIGANILIGLPDQDLMEIKNSVEFVLSLGVKIHLEEYSPIPGTVDFERAGLKLDLDPLYHNNSTLPLLSSEKFNKIQKIKNIIHGV